MKLGDINLGWEYLGALLAREDSTKQAEFLKAFVKECNSWGTSLQVEYQLADINKKLTSNEIQTLSMITYQD